MIIGVDLGTTNSLVAVWKDGEAQVIPNVLGDRLTPSVVGLDDNGDVLVGLPARQRLITHPDKTAAAFKRHMGTEREYGLGQRQFRPEELSSLVLRALKADAEHWLGETVDKAVISVPAYFNDTQRKATRNAGELAGLEVARLINEPTAAALAYGLHRHDLESKFLVFDLGGGTFDVSILELFEGIMEVRASGGDNFLGGEDFVDRLVDGFMADVGRAAGIGDGDLQGRFLHSLRDHLERAKRALSDTDRTAMEITWKEQELSWPLDREQFDKLIEPLLRRLAAPIERVLRDARTRSLALDEVVLVGGATRMPCIRKLVARLFGRLPTISKNPDETVAIGAAIQAGLVMQDKALKDVVMTDVCPYTLGIEVTKNLFSGHIRPGLYLPIIERNTVIPTSRIEQVCTVQDYQREVEVNVFQGESPRVKDNILLGSVTVTVPPKPAEEEIVDIRFTYDVDGLLEVEATVVSTGEMKQLVIQQRHGSLDVDAIKQRLEALAELKIAPRDQAPNRNLLARAERLYQEALGDTRRIVARLINEFEDILARQDTREIEAAQQKMTELLDELEGEPYL
jgi:molecular chaperone HscC